MNLCAVLYLLANTTVEICNAAVGLELFQTKSVRWLTKPLSIHKCDLGSLQCRSQTGINSDHCYANSRRTNYGNEGLTVFK